MVSKASMQSKKIGLTKKDDYMVSYDVDVHKFYSTYSGKPQTTFKYSAVFTILTVTVSAFLQSVQAFYDSISSVPFNISFLIISAVIILFSCKKNMSAKTFYYYEIYLSEHEVDEIILQAKKALHSTYWILAITVFLFLLFAVLFVIYSWLLYYVLFICSSFLVGVVTPTMQLKLRNKALEELSNREC